MNNSEGVAQKFPLTLVASHIFPRTLMLNFIVRGLLFLLQRIAWGEQMNLPSSNSDQVNYQVC